MWVCSVFCCGATGTFVGAWHNPKLRDPFPALLSLAHYSGRNQFPVELDRSSWVVKFVNRERMRALGVQCIWSVWLAKAMSLSGRSSALVYSRYRNETRRDESTISGIARRWPRTNVGQSQSGIFQRVSSPSTHDMRWGDSQFIALRPVLNNSTRVRQIEAVKY